VDVPARPIRIVHSAMTFETMEKRLMSYGITCSERQYEDDKFNYFIEIFY
jgi:hypothetical protein